MQSFGKIVQGLLTAAIKNSLGVDMLAEVAVSQQMGDYKCATAIKLFNMHKKTGSFGCATMKELAEKIIKGVPANQLIEKAEATPMKRTNQFSFFS
jgi:hypothetical protein